MNFEDPTSDAGATGNIDGIDADALMSQIEQGAEITQPAAAPAEATPAATPTTQGAATPAATTQEALTTSGAGAAAPWEKDTITINGQQYQATRAQILQWASQGRNYPQLVEKLKARETELDGKYKNYAEIDQFAKANPDWWKTVVQSYQTTQSQGTPGSQASFQLPPEVQSKIDQLDQFKSSFEAEQAHKALDAEVQDIRKSYPNLSWDTLDESGSSLEMRVYDHALKSGIQSFKTAFKDLMHDDIVKYRADEAKAQAVKELQAQRKQGVLGVSTTPSRGPAPGPTKHKTYDDAASAAMAELGIMAS